MVMQRAVVTGMSNPPSRSQSMWEPCIPSGGRGYGSKGGKEWIPAPHSAAARPHELPQWPPANADIRVMAGGGAGRPPPPREMMTGYPPPKKFGGAPYAPMPRPDDQYAGTPFDSSQIGFRAGGAGPRQFDQARPAGGFHGQAAHPEYYGQPGPIMPHQGEAGWAYPVEARASNSSYYPGYRDGGYYQAASPYMSREGYSGPAPHTLVPTGTSQDQSQGSSVMANHVADENSNASWTKAGSKGVKKKVHVMTRRRWMNPNNHSSIDTSTLQAIAVHSKSKGISQRALARKVECSQQDISLVLRNLPCKNRHSIEARLLAYAQSAVPPEVFDSWKTVAGSGSGTHNSTLPEVQSDNSPPSTSNSATKDEMAGPRPRPDGTMDVETAAGIVGLRNSIHGTLDAAKKVGTLEGDSQVPINLPSPEKPQS